MPQLPRAAVGISVKGLILWLSSPFFGAFVTDLRTSTEVSRARAHTGWRTCVGSAIAWQQSRCRTLGGSSAPHRSALRYLLKLIVFPASRVIPVDLRIPRNEITWDNDLGDNQMLTERKDKFRPIYLGNENPTSRTRDL